MFLIHCILFDLWLNFISEQQEFESKWRPKCKEEEVKTPQLYERNRQLRLELRMLYKQADTIISHAQGMALIEMIHFMILFPILYNYISRSYILTNRACKSVIPERSVLCQANMYIPRYPDTMYWGSILTAYLTRVTLIIENSKRLDVLLNLVHPS
jgi:hypothetical protein